MVVVGPCTFPFDKKDGLPTDKVYTLSEGYQVFVDRSRDASRCGEPSRRVPLKK